MRVLRAALLLGTAGLAACVAPTRPPDPPAWSIAVHGGASMVQAGDYTEQETATIRAELARALAAGGRVLEGGGSSVDAVQAAVVVLEDSPWFNAGKGAVFTRAGTHELDASIMDGARGQAGAVASVTGIRNPIELARRVMDRTPHVMLTGKGAEAFAREQGIERVKPKYFYTERRWRSLQRFLEKEKQDQPKDQAASVRADYYGTVGAVARDRQGRLAAATSTGGLTGKRAGRVGDSPIIGAGTFADVRCAVSATGHGEYFIRHAVAHDICARTRDARMTVGQAAHLVIHDVLKPAGGEGGVTTLDARGEPAHAFNTNWMSRGSYVAGGAPRVAVMADDSLEPVAP